MTEDLPPLPQSAQEIAEVIGREKALRLIGARLSRGKRPWRVCFYVPKVVDLDHWLVALLGWPDARRLAHVFGGQILQPANCRDIARVARDARIYELCALGVPPHEIAEAVSTSASNVTRILSAKPPEESAA